MTAKAELPEPVELKFRTIGQWQLGDVQLFADAVDRMYGYFLTARLIQQRVERAATPARTVPSLAEYVAMLGPSPEGELWSPEPTRRGVQTMPLDLPFGPEVRYLTFIFQNRSLLAPHEQPLIRSWRMSSPGLISLSGVAGIVRELRELLKDLRFRNRQEEQLGELEIARRQLELQRTALSAPTLDHAATQLLGEYRRLEALERAGKLLPPFSLAGLVGEFGAEVRRFGGNVPELRKLLRKILSLKDPRLRNWDERHSTIGKSIYELYLADRLTHHQYEELMHRLQQLQQARVRELDRAA